MHFVFMQFSHPKHTEKPALHGIQLERSKFLLKKKNLNELKIHNSKY